MNKPITERLLEKYRDNPYEFFFRNECFIVRKFKAWKMKKEIILNDMALEGCSKREAKIRMKNTILAIPQNLSLLN